MPSSDCISNVIHTITAAYIKTMLRLLTSTGIVEFLETDVTMLAE